MKIRKSLLLLDIYLVFLVMLFFVVLSAIFALFLPTSLTGLSEEIKLYIGWTLFGAGSVLWIHSFHRWVEKKSDEWMMDEYLKDMNRK